MAHPGIGTTTVYRYLYEALDLHPDGVFASLLMKPADTAADQP